MGLPWIREDNTHCPYCNHKHDYVTLDILFEHCGKVYALNFDCFGCSKRLTIRYTNLGYLKLYKYVSKARRIQSDGNRLG
jgi:hypothetical protein